MKKAILFILIINFLGHEIISAQVNFSKDSLALYSDTIFITANKSERQIKGVSVPISIINAKTIADAALTLNTEKLKAIEKF